MGVGNGAFTRSLSGETQQIQSIADYLSQKRIDLVINLPLRQRRFTPIITNGYLARRLAVEHSIPLVTDVKCAKLLVKVREEGGRRGEGMEGGWRREGGREGGSEGGGRREESMIIYSMVMYTQNWHIIIKSF